MSEPKTAVFTTEQRPDLKLYFPRLRQTVTFADGKYATSDPGVTRALRQHPGVSEQEQHERPAKSASREDWNTYAVSLGIDPEDHSSKDDLIAAIDAQSAGD